MYNYYYARGCKKRKPKQGNGRQLHRGGGGGGGQGVARNEKSQLKFCGYCGNKEISELENSFAANRGSFIIVVPPTNKNIGLNMVQFVRL